MSETRANAHRLLQLLASLRERTIALKMRRLAQLGLSESHVRTLHILASHGPITMGELARLLFLKPPSVTVIVRRLTERGLVERRPHPNDQRAALLFPTDQGRQVLETIYQDMLRETEHFLAKLSPTEQEALLEFLEQLVKATQITTPSMPPAIKGTERSNHDKTQRA
ncbi:MAG: MarR family transcriptional regulator [Anaerolineae bacterium]|nr:MarR family transcriptional regulator [Anaerolineae bacterium]